MKKYLFLYSVFLFYSLIALVEKLVSGYDFLSKTFLQLYGLQILLLFVYALLWQRVLKSFTLNQAYINKGSVFLFNAFWALVIFQERFSIKEIIAILLVLLGIYFINRKP